MKKNQKKQKKYSLEERKNYYYNIYIREEQKCANSQNKSNKLNFASGYLRGAISGLSTDYSSLDKYSKLGQTAGNKARLKSEKIKF